MSKRKSWLSLIKSLFFPETHHKNQHKRSNKKGWLFGRLRKNKGRLPPIAPPPPPPLVEMPWVEAEEKTSKCQEDVQKLVPKCEVEELKLFESVTNESEGLPLNHHHYENHVEFLAVIKIQTFYRGYLARKALRALKGFVRLQAIIRGRAVRRQAMTTLKCLQAIVNIQSEVCTKRSELIHHSNNKNLQLPHQRDDNQKMESNRYTRLDDGLLTKEEEIDIILRKKEAILRRHRSKAYSFNHRHSTDSEDGRVEGRLKYWLEQYANDQTLKNNDKFEAKQLKLKNIESLSNPKLIYMPRRSYHKYKKQTSYIEDSSHPISPTSIPTYMAATESTKAKTRSTSSPRLRPIHFEAYSDGDSPYKHKISPMSSINSELTCLTKVSIKSFNSLQQKSPSFKGLPCPIMSTRNLKDVDNLNSEGLLMNRKFNVVD